MRNTKVKLNALFLLVIVLLVLAVLSVALNETCKGIANSLEYQEEKVIDIPDINDNFNDDSVTVIMNKKTSRINKEYSKLIYTNSFELCTFKLMNIVIYMLYFISERTTSKILCIYLHKTNHFSSFFFV